MVALVSIDYYYRFLLLCQLLSSYPVFCHRNPVMGGQHTWLLECFSMALFLVLLYNSPSGLVIYWTMNNLFSLVKNIFYKMKHPIWVLYGCLCFFVLCADWYLIFRHTGFLYRRLMLISALSIVFFAPLLVIDNMKSAANIANGNTMLNENFGSAKVTGIGLVGFLMLLMSFAICFTGCIKDCYIGDVKEQMWFKEMVVRCDRIGDWFKNLGKKQEQRNRMPLPKAKAEIVASPSVDVSEEKDTVSDPEVERVTPNGTEEVKINDSKSSKDENKTTKPKTSNKSKSGTSKKKSSNKTTK